MADPISAAAAAVAQWVASAVFASSSALSIQAAATLANVAYITAYAVTYVGITAGVSMGLSAIARSQMPDPEGQKVTRKQARPPRVVAFGWDSRMSGPYMLREAVGNKYGAVIALCEGRLATVSAYYLNDHRVTLNDGWVQGLPNEIYGTGDLVRLSTRLGNPTETRHAILDPTFTSFWPSNARGDGIASLAVFAQHRSRESFSRHFPNGEVIPSVVGRPVCYDWRDGTQNRNNQATWKASDNPVVWLVHLEWFRFGRSWDRCIAPVLADLTAEANYCETTVPLKAGGTEKRYRVAGNYPVNTKPAVVREAILASCDGWLSTNGKGHIVLKVGRYVAPTFVLTEDHITGFSWRAFSPDEEAVNELTVSYVSPANDYTEVEAGQWRDESDIAETGVLRSAPLQLTTVYSRAQAMRLAKRKMIRSNAYRRGQIRTDIHGLNGLGHRYIRVQNPTLASMADVPLEVMNVEIDFASGHVVFDVILADPDIDEWNPAEEEGEAVPVPDRPVPVPGNQNAAVRLLNRTTDYPTSADHESITVVGHSGVTPAGVYAGLPAGVITGLDPLTEYGVFWREDVGYEVEPAPASGRMSTGSWIFVGWQATSNIEGDFPTMPPPPGGWGGTGSDPNRPIEVEP